MIGRGWSRASTLLTVAVATLVPAGAALWLWAQNFFVAAVDEVLLRGAGTLVFGGLLGIALSPLLAHVSPRGLRPAADSSALGDLLRQLAATHDRVELARGVIATRRSAQAYGEGMTAVAAARRDLGHVLRALDVPPDGLRPATARELGVRLGEVAAYLDALETECRGRFRSLLDVQQVYDVRAAEAVRRAAAAREGTTVERLLPNEPWLQLQRLPKLGAFLNDGGDYEHAVAEPLEESMALLRAELAGVRGRGASASGRSAARSASRSTGATPPRPAASGSAATPAPSHAPGMSPEGGEAVETPIGRGHTTG